MEVVKAFTTNGLHTEIVIKGTYDSPLFRVSDIGEVLGITNIRSNIQQFDETEKVIHTFDTSGGKQEVSFLTEKGLYKILFKSRKPIAEKFQNWLCEVVKDIRLTGKYNLEKEVEQAKNEITSIEQKHKKELALNVANDRQQYLLRNFGTIGAVVYLIKVHTYESGEYVLKIGESRKGIQARYNEHRTKYGQDIVLLDCFAVKKSKEFESYLHNHDSIRVHRVTDLPGHETERELFHIGKCLSYQTVLNIINANIKSFNEYTEQDMDVLRAENNTLKSLISHSSSDTTFSPEYNLILQEILFTQKQLLIRMDSIEKSNKELLENIKTHSIKTTTNFNTPLPTLGQKLQQINPETMTLYKTYESIADCIKSYKYKMKRPSIVKAIEQNTIYNGYRWAYIERDADPSVVVDIAPTKHTRPQNTGYIAKLEDGKIINVYLDRKSACIRQNYKISALDTPVKNRVPYKGHLYMLYNECSAEQQDVFVKEHGEPVLYKQGIGQYDMEGRIIKEYVCKYDCIKQLAMSDRTLSKALDTDAVYNGSIFRSLGEKLEIL
jgi:prophage antirepressor-like protein